MRSSRRWRKREASGVMLSYSFGVSVADLQVDGGVLGWELHPLSTEVVEDLEAALQYGQTQELVLETQKRRFRGKKKTKKNRL